MTHTARLARIGAGTVLVGAFTLGAVGAPAAHAATPAQTFGAAVNAATDGVTAGLWEGGVCKYLGKYIGPWGCRNR